jgi:hypothetical protein
MRRGELLGRSPARRIGLLAAVCAVTGAALAGAWLALRTARRTLRFGRRSARTALRAATLRLYRRCPDCRRLIRYDARVCFRCGHRRLPRRGRRWR